MDINRLINMLMRLFGRKLINAAVNKGINMAAARGKPEAQMTPAQRAQAAQGRKLAQTARQIRGATRRFF
jgi:hypothetical protein